MKHGHLNSGKRPAHSASTSTVSTSVAPLMPLITEQAPEVPGSVLTLPDIGSSNQPDTFTKTDTEALEQQTEEATYDAVTDDATADSATPVESTSEGTPSEENAITSSTETEQTTEEIANDEIFDVDTIFTSGTFEIAGGGGDAENSIFQGEVEVAQMKMTKDR